MQSSKEVKDVYKENCKTQKLEAGIIIGCDCELKSVEFLRWLLPSSLYRLFWAWFLVPPSKEHPENQLGWWLSQQDPPCFWSYPEHTCRHLTCVRHRTHGLTLNLSGSTASKRIRPRFTTATGRLRLCSEANTDLPRAGFFYSWE